MKRKKAIIVAATSLAAVAALGILWHLSKRELLGPGKDQRTVLTNEVIRIAQEIERMEDLQSGFPPPLTNLTETKAGE